jgi:hypothetical protein
VQYNYNKASNIMRAVYVVTEGLATCQVYTWQYLFLITLTVLANPVMASGEWNIRNLSATSVGTCLNAKLIEHYFRSSNMHGDSEIIQIACITFPGKADWVWMAGYQC